MPKPRPKAERPKPRIRRPMRPKKRSIEVEGTSREVWMYTSGALSQALDRQTQTLRLWEKQGIMPTALYRDTRGRRLYTEDQVRGIVALFREFRFEQPYAWRDSSIPAGMKKLWEDMPEGVWVQKGDPPWKGDSDE